MFKKFSAETKLATNNKTETKKTHCNFLDSLTTKRTKILLEKQKRWSFNFVEEKALYTNPKPD